MPESRQGSASPARSEPPGSPQSSKGEPDPLIGRTISGRFKIVGVIARGGMGKVYKAEQAPLGRICALKVLSPKYEGDRDPEFHKRFFLEAATAAKLTHSNTVTIFDYGQEGDELYYIAMEYIEGKTLHRVLREEGAMNESRVAHIAAQICRSLREAHSLGVVHRDLKPGNILVSDRADERDVVKVLDFGLVKDVTGETEDLTQAGLFMGSPKYMAPEQILGGEITARTDIYSLGVMMYEMLAGKVPFDRGASVGTLMAHVNDVVPPIKSVNPKYSASIAMDNLVMKCLEKDPEKRFVSMKDLLNGLKRIGTEDGSIYDTQESMPMARLDGIVGPNRRADSHPAPSGSHSGIQLPPLSQSGPQQTPTLSSAALSEALGAPSADSLMAPKPKGRAVVWGILAAAVALGIGVFVMFSSKGQGEGSSGGPASGNTGAPTATATTTGAPTATAANTAAVATSTGAAPAGPTFRQVRVETDPPGASVSENGTELCNATPCQVTWKGDATKAEHKLTLNKKGFKAGSLTVAPADEKASFKLELPVPGPLPKQGGAAPAPSGPYKKSPYGD